KSRLRTTPCMFFGDLHQALNDYVTLQACKIPAPAHDNRGNDNPTIAFLLEHYDFSSDPPILKRLEELQARLEAFGKKLVAARNKLIAHLDRAAILAARPLGAATDEEWDQFWLDLEKFINIVHRKVTGSSFYLNGVAGLSDAGDLLKALRRPIRYPA